ncbi:MAG: PQQ-dependent sugar dehydrogenase [Deltaproteobacteria bacterium]|nr:PQQ-dependent sugar dehydrogenase [Deltaproteobacteria bacterium]
MPAFGGELFASPVKLVQHPSDADRWYVVEQRGRVFTLRASNPAGTRALAVDVEALFDLSTGGEEGLLGMAFSPSFAANGEVFFAYTDQRAGGGSDSVVARFASADGGLTFAPVAGNTGVLRFDSEQSNHNAGDLAFGPDGFLYVATGDGGGAGDPDPEDGQNLSTLLGKVLRIDVSTAPYAIPLDNPFAGTANRGEIWAYGLRNPWRMSFDLQTGELWLGDVGQDAREEIDRIVKGGNYGWDCREGDVSFDPDPNCMPPFVEPEVAHPRSEARSITGGYVYRGSALPSLANSYVYGDFATGRVFVYRFQANPTRVDELAAPSGLSPSSFGQGRDGEIYVLDYGGTPSIYQLAP